MIKPIVTDKKELSEICCASKLNTIYTKEAAQDLLDTANSLYRKCDGLAANQIGYSARIIIVKLSSGFTVMINPEYIEQAGKLKSGKEGCLSCPETISKPVSVKRHYKIKIKYTDVDGTERIVKYKNYFARVIQHEMDHLDGISII